MSLHEAFPAETQTNGHADEGTKRLQIIDDRKHFKYVVYINIYPVRAFWEVVEAKCPHLFGSPSLSQQIERWGLRGAGFDYNIVAVFGSQSTGKSERFCKPLCLWRDDILNAFEY